MADFLGFRHYTLERFAATMRSVDLGDRRLAGQTRRTPTVRRASSGRAASTASWSSSRSGPRGPDRSTACGGRAVGRRHPGRTCSGRPSAAATRSSPTSSEACGGPATSRRPSSRQGRRGDADGVGPAAPGRGVRSAVERSLADEEAQEDQDEPGDRDRGRDLRLARAGAPSRRTPRSCRRSRSAATPPGLVAVDVSSCSSRRPR